MTKEKLDRMKEAFSQLMAVLAVSVLVLPVVLLLVGLVVGWEGVRPIVENLVDLLLNALGVAILLAYGLAAAGVVAAFGYWRGDMELAPAWFYETIRRMYLWVAAVVLLTVAPQCLIVPWVARNGVPDSCESSVKYALLWNSPNLSGQLSKYDPIEDLPVRVSGGLLVLQLFYTGVFLVFYGRYLLRGHRKFLRELDEKTRNPPP